MAIAKKAAVQSKARGQGRASNKKELPVATKIALGYMVTDTMVFGPSPKNEEGLRFHDGAYFDVKGVHGFSGGRIMRHKQELQAKMAKASKDKGIVELPLLAPRNMVRIKLYFFVTRNEENLDRMLSFAQEALEGIIYCNSSCVKRAFIEQREVVHTAEARMEIFVSKMDARTEEARPHAKE